MRLAVFVAVMILANQAEAAEVVLGRSGSENVFVWNDSDAHSEAIKLVDAGVHRTNPMLLMRLLACIVPTGTRAIITDAGFASHTILITSGDDSGCRGVIAMEDVSR
ncbi:MAG: hypothetical protein O9309_15075 [Rhizobium sp.]|nr:hypothetical protein [Rhizobium sp.]MCZ8351626.1 hypothetical protein [Rhizobium sp.]